jgi:2-keto-4-pentenoate hydratase
VAEADHVLDLGGAVDDDDRQRALVKGRQRVGAEGGQLRFLGQQPVPKPEALQQGNDCAAIHDASISHLLLAVNSLGWKAGFGTAAAIEKLGTDGPLVGFLTDSTLAPSGTEIDVADWEKPVLETEVGLRLDADVEAGQGRAEIRAAIGALGAAIELVDLGQAGSDPGAILATNVFHRKVLLGDRVTLAADQPPGDTGAAIRPFELTGGERVEVRVAGSTVSAAIT